MDGCLLAFLKSTIQKVGPDVGMSIPSAGFPCESVEGTMPTAYPQSHIQCFPTCIVDSVPTISNIPAISDHNSADLLPSA